MRSESIDVQDVSESAGSAFAFARPVNTADYGLSRLFRFRPTIFRWYHEFGLPSRDRSATASTERKAEPILSRPVDDRRNAFVDLLGRTGVLVSSELRRSVVRAAIKTASWSFRIPRPDSPITHGQWTSARSFSFFIRPMQRRCYRSDWFQEIPTRRLAPFHVIHSVATPLSLSLSLSSSADGERSYSEERKTAGSVRRRRNGKVKEKEDEEKESTNEARNGERSDHPARHSTRSPPSSFDTFYPSLFRLLLIMLLASCALVPSRTVTSRLISYHRGIPSVVSTIAETTT